jgi:TPR repeat protein
MMYMKGESVSKDNVEAYKWFTLAAKNGYPRAAPNQTEVSLEMSGADLVKAMRLAREFKPKQTSTHQEGPDIIRL